MRGVYSKISVKCQTVIPREVRERLCLKPGDTLRYVIRDERVEIERLDRVGEEDPFATFTEWSTDADEKAYGDL